MTVITVTEMENIHSNAEVVLTAITLVAMVLASGMLVIQMWIVFCLELTAKMVVFHLMRLTIEIWKLFEKTSQNGWPKARENVHMFVQRRELASMVGSEVGRSDSDCDLNRRWRPGIAVQKRHHFLQTRLITRLKYTWQEQMQTWKWFNGMYERDETFKRTCLY